MKNPYENLISENFNEYKRGLYDRFPTFSIPDNQIKTGYQQLVKSLLKENSSGKRVIVIDGYNGVNWDNFKKSFSNNIKDTNLNISWHDFEDCLRSEDDILKQIDAFLGGEDPLWGTHYPYGLEAYFDPVKVSKLRAIASALKENKDRNIAIIYGVGSSLIELWDSLWYMDVPKDVIQERARKGDCNVIGKKEPSDFGYFYKRSYFVDWPALNRSKKNLLPEIDTLIDLQDEKNPKIITGKDFRNVLHLLSESPFRVRPWFYPGPWGGKFMQSHMGLDPEKPNFAWSFESIVPENGIVIKSSNINLEFSFDFLMYQENRKVLGEDAARRFRYEWPIRFDYLDTIDGGNLSTQVHPRPEFIREEFGETFTQDETYYISVAKENAKVYLGLKEDCNVDEFKKALMDSEENGTSVDMDSYIHSVKVKPHDLVAIPNGLIHCSGEGNLVLEISATPYIFTFKIYDYLRKDLNGNFRQMNIERAFKNVRTNYREDYVKENFLPSPKLLRSDIDWEEYEIYNRPESFYNIHRIEFDTEIEIELAGRALTMNLVEGRKVEIEDSKGRITRLALYETILVPEATKKLKIKNISKYRSKLLYSYIRPSSTNGKLSN